MESHFLTDTGRVREHNEDSVTILKNINGEYLLAVADGMGGHKAGEVASSMAINHLTKEFDLLELFVKNPGKVYTRENLLDIAWGVDYPGDARTVDVHIRRLREKIENSPSDPKYVHTKWGVGYYYKN